MNTPVRIVMNDEQLKRYKDIFGEKPTRANVKVRVAAMFFQALGEEKPRTMAMKTVNISDAAKEKVRESFKRKKKG